MGPEFFAGFVLQATLIFGLGAQNLFLIDRGIRKESHFKAALICSVCDVLLVFVGVAGAGSYFAQNDSLKVIFTVLGVVFLCYYGATKFLETPKAITEFTDKNISPGILWQSLGFSLLNPHVYLDTVVLIGSYASQFGTFEKRIYFGAGASAYSTIWFFSLAFFSAAFQKFARRPQFLKNLNRVAGLLLIYLGLKLGFELLVDLRLF